MLANAILKSSPEEYALPLHRYWTSWQ